MYLSNCCQGQEGILPLLCIPAYLLVQKCQFQYQLPGAYLHRLRHHLEKSETYISLRLRRRLNRWYARQGKYLFSIFLIMQYMVYVRGQLCVIRYKNEKILLFVCLESCHCLSLNLSSMNKRNKLLPIHLVPSHCRLYYKSLTVKITILFSIPL